MGAALATLARRARGGAPAALKAYGAFALLHVLYKLWTVVHKWRRFEEQVAHLPGGKCDPTGKSVRQNFHRLHDWNMDEVKDHRDSPLVRRSSPEPLLICNTRESIKYMLKDEFESFTKPGPASDPLFSGLTTFLGGGIFVVRHGKDLFPREHAIWFDQRKTASKIFTKNTFKNVAHKAFVRKAGNLVRAVHRTAALNEGAPRNGLEHAVDLQTLFFSFTFDSIQEIFFGLDVDSVTGEPDVFATTFDSAHRNMVDCLFGNIGVMIASRYVLPFPLGDLGVDNINTGLLVPLVRAFDRRHRTFMRSVAYLRNETRRLVRAARADPNLAGRNDMISNFIKAGKYSDDDLIDVVLNLIIAGRDTTACTLSWLFYELSINPLVQERLAEEVSRELGEATPTLADLDPARLPYLNGCVYETLRLHSPVPIDIKTASRDVTFPCGTCVPSGTKLGFAPYALGRDPVRYPDPLKFDPTRWIPFEEPDLFEFPVFQAGPRTCLGMALSLFETRLVTATLIREFEFALQPGQSISYATALTMSIVNNEEKTSHSLLLAPRARKSASSTR